MEDGLSEERVGLWGGGEKRICLLEVACVFLLLLLRCLDVGGSLSTR